MQEVAQGREAHALMMGHKAADELVFGIVQGAAGSPFGQDRLEGGGVGVERRGPADQNVVAAGAGDDVGAGAADQDIEAAAAVDPIAAAAADQDVIACIPEEGIVARAADGIFNICGRRRLW